MAFLRTPLAIVANRRDAAAAQAARDGARQRALDAARWDWYREQGLTWAHHAPWLLCYGN